MLVGEERQGREGQRKHHRGTTAREAEKEAGQRHRGTGRGTCCRLLLHTQCCQPPSAPLESRQDVQLGRR